MADIHLLAISVGNSRTQWARFTGDQRASFSASLNEEGGPMLASLRGELREAASGEHPVAVVIASVNNQMADRIEVELKAEAAGAGREGVEVLRLGRDVPIPILHSLDESGAQTVGQDRLMAAMGAYAAAQQACVVVDAGSAVTVDFVDGEGAFQGGAIAPGARMMLRAMHERTAALPNVAFTAPASAAIDADNPFGKNTPEAMLNGVFFSIRGLVRLLLERYAEKYGAYPQVIATGGDADLLFETDEIVEHIVPDLALRGVHEAVKAWLEDAPDRRASDGR